MLRWVVLKKVDNNSTISYEWNNIRFRKPSHVIVQWPSGKHERCKVTIQYRGGSNIVDGQHRAVCSQLWFVKSDHHGLKVEIPIEKVGIAIENNKIVQEMLGV